MTKRDRRLPFPAVLLSLVAIVVGVTMLRTYVFPASAPTLVRGKARSADAPSSINRFEAQPRRASSSSASSTNVYAATESGKFSPAVEGIPARVYVPNGVAGTVEEIDPRTFRIIRKFPVGQFPEHITPSWDLKWLYVDVAASSALGVINPRTGKLVRMIKGIDHPYNLYFTPDGSKAIVVAEYYNRLDFRDPHTWRLIKSVPIPGSGPDHLDFSADGSYLMLGTEFDGNVFKVDVRRMKVVGRVHVGGLPVDVKLSPDGSVFYVANQGLGGVSIVDPVRMRPIAFLKTGKGAHGMAVSRDTRLLYLSNRLAGSISVISFQERKVVATWKVGGSPDMLQVSPDGRQLWVSNRYSGTVFVIDTASGVVMHVFQVGTDPHGLAYFPQPGRYSLGHNGVYR
jgi:YVTN family beta-propeller protein